MKTCTTRLTGENSVQIFPLQYRELMILFFAFFFSFPNIYSQSCTPVLDCSTQVVSCADSAANDFSDPGYRPIFIENCGIFTESSLVWTVWPSAIVDCDSIYSKVIYRMWGVPGFPNLCTDTTYVLRVNVLSDSLVCPDGRDTVLCGVDPDPLEDLTLRAPYYLIPGIDTFGLTPATGPACGVFVHFVDDVWPSCGNTRTVLRTWVLKDLCGSELICYDTIVYIDTIPPVVSFDTSGLSLEMHEINGITGLYLTDTIGMSPTGCVGHGLAPYATVSDNCSNSEDITVSVMGQTSLAFLHYNADEVISLSLWNVPGQREILIYRSVDACHNTRMDTVVLIVSDETPANAVCHDAINLSLTNVGEFTFMKAASLDAESSDNCAVYLILARRTDWETACGYQVGEQSAIGDYYQNYADWVVMDPGICQDIYEFGFAPEVPFCCEDIGRDIMVEILVIDFNCNVDRCWGIINAEDKLAPIVVESLPDITITCNAYSEFYRDIFEAGNTEVIQAAFGKYALTAVDQEAFSVQNLLCSDLEDTVTLGYYDGLISDNCDGSLSERLTLPDDGCSNGFVLREFIASVSGDHGMQDLVYATQRIHIERCPLDIMNITLATKDTTVYDCDLTFGLDGKVAIQTSGPSIPTLVSECSQYGVGYFDKVFEILAGVGCYKVLRTWCVVDWCQITDAGDWVSLAKQPGTMTFHQYIKIIDTIPPEIEEVSMVADIHTVSCSGSLSAEVDASDNCGAPAVKWELRSQSGAVIVKGAGEIAAPAELLPPGAYSLIWTATDPCGNVSTLTSNFTISSNALPGVIARSSLSTTLTPMDGDSDGIVDLGMAEIWAEEFNSSSSPACGGSLDNLHFLIAPGFADENTPVPPDSATSLQFTCADYVSGPTVIPVQFWVKDTVSGGADFVNVMVLLYDNNQVCQAQQPPKSTASVSGQISTESQEQIANVRVRLSNIDHETTVTTGLAGLYETGFPLVDHTMIIPEKNTDHANGISTADLIKVQKHILGIKPLTSPYKLIAADVNRDERINPIDLIQMRRILLGKIKEFPQNSSWRFVDADYRFVRPEKAIEEDFPEYIELHASNEREAQKNFIGVKIGDLDDNVFASRSNGRSTGNVVFSMPDRVLVPGETYSIPVHSTENMTMEGLQLQFQIDPAIIRLNGLESGLVTIEDEDTYLEDLTQVSLSTINTNGQNLEKADVLFYLNLTVISEGQLSQALALSKRSLKPELYHTTDQISGISLSFDEEDRTGINHLLMQNRPNPFRSETIIEFWIPQSGEAQLRIYDPSGRLLKEIKQHFVPGQHHIAIDGSELTPGILYYELQTSMGRDTKRMILTE